MRKLIWILIGYLNGSLLFGQYITKLIKGKDIIRESRDGNPGTANAFMLGGAVSGVLTLICELLKGFLPVFVFCHLFPDSDLLPAAIIAPVLGHAFPVFHEFQGGKAIAVSFGALLGLFPNLKAVFILVFYYLLFSAVRISPHWRRSIVTFLCFAATSCVLIPNRQIVLGCLGIAVIVVGKHIKMKDICRE